MRWSYASGMWTKIWSWVVVGAIVLFFLGGGVSFMTSSHPWIADAFYLAGAVLFLTKFLTWEEAKQQERTIRRRTSTYAIAGTVLVTISAVWGNHNLNQSPTTPPLVSQQLPKNKPEATLQPQTKDVALRFIYPKEPALMIVNKSDSVYPNKMGNCALEYGPSIGRSTAVPLALIG
jgi:hypothetical protein